MNRKQRKWLWIGIAVFVLMGLFPPWYHTGNTWSQYAYGFLLHPPGNSTQLYSLDTHRLYVQWIMVAVVTGGLMLTFRQTKETKLPAEPGK